MINLIKITYKNLATLFKKVKHSGYLYINIAVLAVSIPMPLCSQTVVGEITRPGLKPWSLAVYENGNKLFVGDRETGNLLIYDGTSFDLLAELPIEGGCGGSSLNVHEVSGKLYFNTFPYGRHMAVVNAETNELIGYIELDAQGMAIDQELGRVYTISRIAPFVLYVIDVATDKVNTVSLSNAGLTSGLAVNPVTHEVFIGYLQGESLDIVDAITMERTTVSGINGRCVIINWLENKVYGEIGTFDGFWVYDRDIDSMKVCITYNDANPAIFNPTSNRVHTCSEVDGYTTIIEGSDDSWINMPIYSGLIELGVRYSTNHVYYVGSRYIIMLHGASLERLVEIPNVWVNYPNIEDIIINQSTGQVFVSYSSNSVDGIVLVIEDTPDTVSTPTFNPSASTYTEAQDVTINCTTPGAVIYYTTDGSNPTDSDSVYTNPIHISNTTTFKARAYKTDWNPSGVATGTYFITGTSVHNLEVDYPTEFFLARNYPNPFNPETIIEYQIASNCHVSIIIYDINSKEVKSLVKQNNEPGCYSIAWSGRNNYGIKVTTGIYLVYMIAENFKMVQKITLIR